MINLHTVNFSGYKPAEHSDFKRTTAKLKSLPCDMLKKNNAANVVNFYGAIEYAEQINHSDLKEALNCIKKDIERNCEEMNSYMTDGEVGNSYEKRLFDATITIYNADKLLTNIDDELLKNYIDYSLQDIVDRHKSIKDFFDSEELKNKIYFYEVLNEIIWAIKAYNELNNKISSLNNVTLESFDIKTEESDTRKLYKDNPKLTAFSFIKNFGENQAIYNFSQVKELFEVNRIWSLTMMKKDDFIKNHLYEKYYVNNLELSEESKKKLLNIYKELGVMVFTSNVSNTPEQDIDLIYNELNNWYKSSHDKKFLPKNIVMNAFLYEFAKNNSTSLGLATDTNVYIKPSQIDRSYMPRTLRHELIHIADKSSVLLDDYANNWNCYKNAPRFLFNKKHRHTVELIRDINHQWDDKKENSIYAKELKTAGVQDSYVKYAHKNHNEFIAVAGSAPEPEKYTNAFKRQLVMLGLPEFVFNLPKLATVGLPIKEVVKNDKF